MTSISRIMLMDSAGLSPAGTHARGSRRSSQAIKLLLVVGALSCAGYGAYQIMEQSKDSLAAREARPNKPEGSKISFFQGLIEADRAVLEKRPQDRASNRPSWIAENFRNSTGNLNQPAVGDGAANRPLRHFFTRADSARAPGTPTLTPYLNNWVAKTTPATPVRNAPANAAAPPAARSPQERTQSQRPQQTFGEVRTKPAVQASAQGASRPAFAAPASSAGLQPPARPVPDDIAFAQSAISAADHNVADLHNASAVIAEFERRYPNAPETAQLKRQIDGIRRKQSVAMLERSHLTPDTLVAPVLFAPLARQEISACLERIPGLQRLSAVNRPVTNEPDRLAFLVAARVDIGDTVAPDTRDAALGNARARMATPIAHCLTPLFAKGTVSLAFTDGLDADLTRIRIESTEGATVFGRAVEMPG